MIRFIVRLVLAYLAQNLMEHINPIENYFATVVVEFDGDKVHCAAIGKPRKRPWRKRGGHNIHSVKRDS